MNFYNISQLLTDAIARYTERGGNPFILHSLKELFNLKLILLGTLREFSFLKIRHIDLFEIGKSITFVFESDDKNEAHFMFYLDPISEDLAADEFVLIIYSSEPRPVYPDEPIYPVYVNNHNINNVAYVLNKFLKK